MRASKLTTLLVASIFILVVGMMLNLSLLYWMAGILLSLPAVGWGYAVLQSKGITIRRRLPPVARVGESITVELEAQNTTALPKLQLWLVDALPPGMRPEARPEVALQLPPLSTMRGGYPVQLQRRGRVRLEDTRVV